VDSWTSYLAASRASPLALLESVTELKTLDTCFHSLPRESDNADQKLFSSKTWKELSQQKQTTGRAFSNMSSERWKTWITAQRQEYSQRVKSAHHTNESASLSWATPEARNQVGYQTSNGKKFWRLGSQVKHWLTPRANDKGSGESQKTFLKRMNDRSKNCHQSLAAQVKHWPTPCARDWEGCGNAIPRKDGKTRLDNIEAIAKFGLPDREKLNKSGKSLESVETITTTIKPRQIGKLNPAWVEQIMGIQVGWTDLGSWGME
jgi:hypothetical protein